MICIEPWNNFLDSTINYKETFARKDNIINLLPQKTYTTNESIIYY